MRVLLWHGWLLEGSGSNVYAARVTAALRRAGHDVLLLCQEGHPERYPFLDAWGRVDGAGVWDLTPLPAEPAPGRAVLLRPSIGPLLPVFVYDEYEGFEVKTFLDLTGDELEAYLERNAAALRQAVRWHRSEAVVAGHAVPGAVVAQRALGPGAYLAKVHGSDLEYAVRAQPRYLALASPALEGARAVLGGSSEVLARAARLVPSIRGRTVVVPPGVDARTFRPLPRRGALERAAALLEADPQTAAGRPAELDREVWGAVERRAGHELGSLPLRYDQGQPDPEAGARLRALAAHRGPLVGYFGKLIPQKGVELLLTALPSLPSDTAALVVGFGLHRERLAALALALDRGDPEAVRWLLAHVGLDVPEALVRKAAGIGSRIVFTGRLDHRYAPFALAALDVLVVPSRLEEAFAMVTVEGAATGALPVVAGHSGLAEVAGALEEAVGRPGWFSFPPGPRAREDLARAVARLLALPEPERRRLRAAVSQMAAREWSWDRTAERLLAAATRPPGGAARPAAPPAAPR